MELTRWKLIAGGAALVGVAAGGIAATADDGIDLNDRRGVIELTDNTDNTGGANVVADDGSPESADSPNESVEESADSPFDSPDDAGFVDPSAESADSPNESVAESADSPNLTAEDSPAPAPAPVADDSPADSENSDDSPDSADSDD